MNIEPTQEDVRAVMEKAAEFRDKYPAISNLIARRLAPFVDGSPMTKEAGLGGTLGWLLGLLAMGGLGYAGYKNREQLPPWLGDLFRKNTYKNILDMISGKLQPGATAVTQPKPEPDRPAGSKTPLTTSGLTATDVSKAPRSAPQFASVPEPVDQGIADSAQATFNDAYNTSNAVRNYVNQNKEPLGFDAPATMFSPNLSNGIRSAIITGTSVKPGLFERAANL